MSLSRIGFSTDDVLVSAIKNISRDTGIPIVRLMEEGMRRVIAEYDELDKPQKKLILKKAKSK